MSKKKDTFVMPGAEPDDLDNDDSPKVDLSFMEETDEEREEREAMEARKAERQKEIDDEKAAAEAKANEAKEKAEEDDKKAEEKAEEKVELSDDEKAEAEKIEKDREAKKKKEPMIPKSRLDEVLARNKELTAKLNAEQAAREARKPVADKDAKEFDFDAKETEYMKLVMEGETDKALQVRKQIRAAEQAQLVAQTSTHSAQDSEAVALAKAAAEIEANFPQFVKGHEKFNEEATKVVIKMRDGLIATGTNAVEALNEAVEFAVRKFGFDETIETGKTNVVDLDEKRKADATKKKIDAQQKQPPDLKGEGNKTKKAEPNAVDEMSDEEFNALPESAKRRLRGDFL